VQAPLRGREVPRRNEELPGALIRQHPLEGPPSHIQNGPRETPVPQYVQVLHHQNRLGFRQLTCAGSPGECCGCGDATRNMAFASLREETIHFRPCPVSGSRAFFCFSERCFERRFKSKGSIRVPSGSTARQCPTHPPVPGPPGARDPGATHERAYRLSGDGRREDAGLPGLKELQWFIHWCGPCRCE